LTESEKTIPELRSLIISYNKILTINGLEQLKKLDTLDLSYNKIKKLTGVKLLKNLKTINLAMNNISASEEKKITAKYKDKKPLVYLGN